MVIKKKKHTAINKNNNPVYMLLFYQKNWLIIYHVIFTGNYYVDKNNFHSSAIT